MGSSENLTPLKYYLFYKFLWSTQKFTHTESEYEPQYCALAMDEFALRLL
jgi:hypothetical protein